jgi:peptidoglycan/LPS O-acetylase OafA/YrhL
MRRIPELDAIRGSAAIGVVLFHAFPHAFYWGWSCVDLFFVLSGYLITTIIITQQGCDGFLRSFYLRRIRRIWPVYFLTLGVVVILNRFSRTGYPTDGLALHLLFLQNTPRYFGLPIRPFISSFATSWTVAIEEQFYVIWPLLVVAIGRAGIPWMVGILIALSAAFRIFIPDHNDLMLTRCDGLALGCFLAWLLLADEDPASSRRNSRVLALAATVGAAYFILYLIMFWANPIPGWRHASFTAFGLLFFALIGSCVRYSGARLLTPLRNPVLRWFGTISYSLYLFHLPVFYYCPSLLGRAGIRSPTLQTGITWILVVSLPTISWYCLERPILDLCDRGRKRDAMVCAPAARNPIGSPPCSNPDGVPPHGPLRPENPSR